jgi:protein gp37
MNPTTIPWCDLTWSPMSGCQKGCEYCYARGIARRFGSSDAGVLDGKARLALPDGRPYIYGFTPTLYPHRLDEPPRRKKSAIIFVCSMGDLFDSAVPDEFRDRVFATIHDARQHTFVTLTKRAGAMRDYFRGARWRDVLNATGDSAQPSEWPLPNLWLGVSVTNQADADERIPILLDTPAARRMVSVEPMLGPVDLERYEMGEDADLRDGLDFVAIGAKTPGPALHEQTAFTANLSHEMPAGRSFLRALLAQCEAAGVPACYKHGAQTPVVDGRVYDARPGGAL